MRIIGGQHFWQRFSDGTMGVGLTLVLVSVMGFLFTMVGSSKMDAGLAPVLFVLELGVFFLGFKIFILSLIAAFISWCFDRN